MKSGVVFGSVILVLSLLAFTSIASAYVVDYTLDSNTSYMCGEVVNATLQVWRMSDEPVDHNKTFTITLFAPGVVNPNGDLSCTFDEKGFVLTRCNGFGIGKRQIIITDKMNSGDWSSARAIQDDTLDVGDGIIVPFNGNDDGHNSTNHAIPVSDGMYDIWIDTGVYVDDSTGTCFMGTYGTTLVASVNAENTISDYLAYEVYGGPSSSEGPAAATAAPVVLGAPEESHENEGGHLWRGNNLNNAHSEVVSSSASPLSPSVDAAYSVSEIGKAAKAWGASAFLMVMILGVSVAIYMRMKN